MSNNKLCTKCGESKPFSEYYKAANTKDKFYAYCKTCCSARGKLYTKNNKVKINKHNQKPHRRYNVLVNAANQRNISVKITKSQYIQYCEQHTNCFYCDKSMEGLTGGGLNRVDRTKPYSISNVKRCCGECNTMMGDLTKEEFVKRAYKIARRMD